MSTAYLLTFALALVPVISQIVTTVFIFQGIFLARRPGAGRTIPVWLPFLMAGIALAFTLWHTAHTIDIFFPDYDAADFTHKEILGVRVPLELADKVQNVVGSLPFALLSLYMIGMLVWLLFQPRHALQQATIPVWRLKLLAAVGLVFFAWLSWDTWGDTIGYVQAFF